MNSTTATALAFLAARDAALDAFDAAFDSSDKNGTTPYAVRLEKWEAASAKLDSELSAAYAAKP